MMTEKHYSSLSVPNSDMISIKIMSDLWKRKLVTFSLCS